MSRVPCAVLMGKVQPTAINLH